MSLDKLHRLVLDDPKIDRGYHVTSSDFSPRDYAILKCVWSLTEGERKLLDANFILQCEVSSFLSLIYQDSKLGNWRLTHNSRHFELSFISCSINSLRAKPEGKLILSGRISSKNRFFCILVKRFTTWGQMTEEELDRKFPSIIS